MLNIVLGRKIDENTLSWSHQLALRRLYKDMFPVLNKIFKDIPKDELDRIQGIDITEISRMAHSVIFTVVPDIVWLLDVILAIQVRRFHSAVNNILPILLVPCVFFDPYVCFTQVLQNIAKQWKKQLISGVQLNSAQKQLLLKECLHEWLDSQTPLQMDEKWLLKMQTLNTQLWDTFPGLRPYVKHRHKWLETFNSWDEQQQQETNLPQDLRIWQDTVASMQSLVKKLDNITEMFSEMSLKTSDTLLSIQNSQAELQNSQSEIHNSQITLHDDQVKLHYKLENDLKEFNRKQIELSNLSNLSNHITPAPIASIPISPNSNISPNTSTTCNPTTSISTAISSPPVHSNTRKVDDKKQLERKRNNNIDDKKKALEWQKKFEAYSTIGTNSTPNNIPQQKQGKKFDSYSSVKRDTSVRNNKNDTDDNERERSGNRRKYDRDDKDDKEDKDDKDDDTDDNSE